MVKINGNKYYCEWCLHEFDWNKVEHSKNAAVNTQLGHHKMQRPGRHTTVATLKCPECNKNVSQRRADGSK